MFRTDLFRVSSRIACGLAAALLLTVVPAHAQDTGTLSGTVVDSSGEIVPGATVTLTDERTGSARTQTTSGAGTFTFHALLPGTYTVKIELSGFRTYVRQRNVVDASAQVDLGKVTLEVGRLTEVVSVAAEGTQVETRNSDYTGLLTANQISQIQTKGRDVVSLLRLMPGVRYTDDIEAMGESFGSSIPNIEGQRIQWNSVTVDGLNGNELSGTNRLGSATNLDAIAEVKVQFGTYKAEDGRTGGADIKIITKSGGQRYSGSLYDYVRRDAWNANSWNNIRNDLPKAKYHYDTYGASIGGPIGKRLFFFYSMETPQAQQPGPVRKYRLPTALERQGDFSQSFDSNGTLIVIKDPLTGQPFLGNKIPANRINANGLALMNMMPAPNRLDASETANLYNFIRQETPNKPRWNHVGRVDWRRTANDSLYVTFNSFTSTQNGSEITAGPAKWGYFNGTYDFGNEFVAVGHHHIFGSNLVNELYGGVRRATEGFGTATSDDRQRIQRSNAGFTVGQFNPQLNVLGVLPQVSLGLSNSGAGVTSPDFTYDQRLGETDHDWLSSITEDVTWLKGNHTIKGGAYLEYIRNNEARGGLWMGQFDFSRDTNNPLDSGFALSNMLLGNFKSYTETNAYRSTRNRHWESEWYLQDTWRPQTRLTLDYGLRFLWYTPFYQANEQTAAFVPDRYDPAKAPRMYSPTRINNKNYAIDPVTGQLLPEIYVGAFVPGSGDPADGMVSASDPNYPKGFRDMQPPLPEPRLGVAYDLFGNRKTALHMSAGVFHQGLLGGGSQGNLQGPPNYVQSTIYYNSINSFLDAGSLTERPVSVNGLERHAHTPVAYRVTAGVQQDIGWGTVVDVAYVGALDRYLEMQTNINPVADGSRFLPANVDPRNGKPLPDDFLRPYRGFSSIDIRGNWGTSSYNSLQIQANRRYIHGLQFGVAYTFARGYGYGDSDPVSVSILRPLHAWYWGPNSNNQNQSLVVNYTYDLPRSRSANVFARGVLDGWQLSGENAFVSGDWTDISMSTTDGFDFVGGTEGARPVMTGDPRLSASERTLAQWFNTAVFQRPSGRGDIGNEPNNVIQLPGIRNWNLALFKNFRINGSRALQYRIEAYNVLNTLQYNSVDTGARFDPQGNQVNANFGTVNGARNPRIIQMSVRFTF